jgi:lipid-binding SYLF domain-containing protein
VPIACRSRATLSLPIACRPQPARGAGDTRNTAASPVQLQIDQSTKEPFMRMLQLTTTSLLLALCACATAPRSQASRESLEARADATLREMRATDPGLGWMLDRAAGYAVFPSIGKGGVIAGAAYGRGVLYEGGRQTGFVDLSQGSIGAQIGAQTFAELIVLDTPDAVQRIKSGDFSISGSASAVALTTGAARTASFDQGVAVFVLPRGGLMAELSVTGQQINFAPRGG